MEGVVLVILAVVGALAVVSTSIFAFARRNSDRPRSVRLAVFAAVMTFVVATAGFVALARAHYFDTLGRPHSTAGIQVVFTSQTYDPGTALFSLNGVVRGLKPGQDLWVVFRNAQQDHIFPAPAPCGIQPGGLFSCRQRLTGRLSPEVTNVRGSVVAATPQAAATFMEYNSGPRGTTGLRELPDGATRVSQISVGS
ncbi:MAG: hypothetical protein JO364_01525 [Pseudonocardiales bacterium]|nr:hypothetical protein [Pseudonocardiales bacterium]MBV9028994.1 hypothetical protein [Pseudonocardiales bacterium]